MPFLGPIQLRAPREIQETNAINNHVKYLDSAGADERINIRHPGYGSNYDLLFSLHTPDHASAGVHFGLIIDACAIIADNRRDGWLSIDREGKNPVEGDPDHILSYGDYWYNVPGDNEKWPIVTCFQDWHFPSTLPPLWRRVPKPQRPANTTAPSTFSTAIVARDLFCRISAHYTGTEVARICPREESEWFFANGMSRWNNDTSLGEQSLLDDHANLILMRSDIHKAFDDGKFIPYPKDTTGFSLHIMEPSLDLGILYHNARTHPIVNCRPEFLYARFAWSLFRFLSGFLAMPADRAVITVKSGSEQTRVLELRKSVDIRERIASSRSRSPRKRKTRALDAEERDQDRTYKRRRSTGGTQRGASVTTPLLEIDAGTPKQSQVSAGHEFPADDEGGRIQQLRDEHLRAQRPPDFVPFSGSPFESTSDAKTVLERLGFEILDDDGGNG